MRNEYRIYLQKFELKKNTIQTALNDTFYILKNVGKDEFWNVVMADDFEERARNALTNALRLNSKGNYNTNVNSYLSHLRKFRNYIMLNREGTVLDSAQMLDQKAVSQKENENTDIPIPSSEQVDYYLRKWDELEKYHAQEDALDKLFLDLCPRNTDIEDVLLKVATLNAFYSTNIFSVYPVAKHILSLDIDVRLKVGDVTIMEDIQKVTINGRDMKLYSFATKYCSHHNPLDFPIYDSYVEKVLCYFRDRDAFADFKTSELKSYIKFKSVLIDFQRFYGLDKHNFVSYKLNRGEFIPLIDASKHTLWGFPSYIS